MHTTSRLAILVAALLACSGALCQPAGEGKVNESSGRPGVRILSFVCPRPLTRAHRRADVQAMVRNEGEAPAEVRIALRLPEGVRVVGSAAEKTARLDPAEEADLHWQVTADEPVYADVRLDVQSGGATVAEASFPIRFLPAMEVRKGYIPEPKPIETSVLIGAHNCPLWESDKPEMWAQVRKHPERIPALGLYGQEDPEVADWETKWAVEHGVSFFVYCWYRASQGKPVEQRFGSAIHDALFKSRFVSRMKFTIMWENQSRGVAGVADEKDLMENLLPYWIETYFRHPSYLRLDNRPLLFIYRPEFLVQDLGSVENVRRAFDLMREACRKAGFGGLYLLGEYRGLDPNHLTLMKQLGLDYTFAYVWYVPNSPPPAVAVDTQMEYIRKTQDLDILPQVVTVSQAWSGWRDEGSIWKIPPTEFGDLLARAKEFVGGLPRNELGSRLLLLDNWNEWSEGHYIAPYTEYGFGYLDAVRKVFSQAPEPHTDLIPGDLGMGPYDTAYWQAMQRDAELRRLVTKKALKPGAEEEGLVGWWAFDEADKSPVALDYSGHRLGGKLQDAKRAPGFDGKALLCEGGCVVVPTNPLLSPTQGLTVECWVKTDLAGQDNRWLVNRVFGGCEDSGYRLGVLAGKPCFEVPQTAWSHHLSADIALPTGRWVHLAGTFDGKVMRLYVDGALHGTMDRLGPVKPNDAYICLGSYEVKHPAYFTGLLDEVRLYNRALSAEEIAAHADARDQ
jgi:Concanavalin A-like lectin/glucanases superfamily/Glycosyltransferase WbsX